MSKKILVLTGSSRKGGNSDLLADAFTKGAKEAGHPVTRFECGHKIFSPVGHVMHATPKRTHVFLRMILMNLRRCFLILT